MIPVNNNQRNGMTNRWKYSWWFNVLFCSSEWALAIAATVFGNTGCANIMFMWGTFSVIVGGLSLLGVHAKGPLNHTGFSKRLSTFMLWSDAGISALFAWHGWWWFTTVFVVSGVIGGVARAVMYSKDNDGDPHLQKVSEATRAIRSVFEDANISDVQKMAHLTDLKECTEELISTLEDREERPTKE